MMGKFTHYLVTRFNVPVDNWDKDKTGTPTLDDHWTQHRIDLFKKYCIPGILNQTEKNFSWIIYCDPDTKSKYLDQIKAVVRLIPQAMIRTASGPAEMLTDLQNFLSMAATLYIITSRLDNDDSLGKKYIKSVHDHFREKDKLLLNPLGGILYDTGEQVMTQMKNSRRNHYTSLIEKNKNPNDLLTVLGFPHDNPPDTIHIENIPGHYYWLKIIHDRNVKSRLKGKPIFRPGHQVKEEMGDIYFPVSILNTFKYTLKRIVHKIIPH